MPALSVIENLASESTQQTIMFIDSRCLRRRLNSCECDNCLSCCPADAIIVSNRQIKLDSGKCTGCMLCSTVCPNDAFEYPVSDIEKSLFAKEETELVVISCSRQTQIHQEEQVVPCLGSLSLEHLLALGLAGSSETAFNILACENCENRSAADFFLSMLRRVQEQAGDLLKTKFIVLTDPDQITSLHNENRRSFLSSLKSNLLSAISSQFSYSSVDTDEIVKKSRRIPKRVDLKRNLIEHVDDVKIQLISSLCDFHLAVNENCSLCPLCTGICPTGAVKIERSDGEKKIVVEHTLCSGCGLCVSFCKNEAIKLHHPSRRSAIKDITNQDKYLVASG